jgi:hypothetical protein
MDLGGVIASWSDASDHGLGYRRDSGNLSR